MQSIVGIPRWVQLWMLLLMGTNMASLAFLHTPVGRWTALTFGVVCMFNMPTMMLQGGLTRLLSLPHFAWLPLVVYLYSQLYGAAPLPPGGVRSYALAVLVVNSISLAFDVLEAWRWFTGQREVLGLDRPAPI
jgi:hypothetical protein